MLEILKLREEEEEEHRLTISIYDTKRNEKIKEYREAMVSLVSWPRPWLFLDTAAPQASRTVRTIRDSARELLIGDKAIDTIVVLLSVELTISVMNTKGCSGARRSPPTSRGCGQAKASAAWDNNGNRVPTSTQGSPQGQDLGR